MDQESNRGQLDQQPALVNGNSDDPARIREQIEVTRAQLSGTVDELQERLQPERLVNQAKDAVRGAVGQKVKNIADSATHTATRVAEQAQSSAGSLAHQARVHPAPAALALAGLTWWMTRRSSDVYGRDRGWGGMATAVAAGAAGYYLLSTRMLDDFDGPGTAAAARNRVRRAGAVVDEARHRAQAAVGGYAEQIGGQVHELSETARVRAHELSETARVRAEETAVRLKGRASEAASRLRAQSDELGRTAEQWMDESPFAVGVAALTIGAVAGLSLPLSDSENRALGAARRTLLDVAKQSLLPSE